MQNKEEELLRTAYYHWRKSDFHSIELLPASGSHRKYYRILSDFEPCLCVYNEDEAENRAYLEFSKQFLKLDLPVPHILQMDSNKKIYFVEDLGNTTLFSFLQENRKNGKISSQTEAYYFKAVEELLKFQLVAGRDFDYSSAYPRKAFDAQSMQWDLSSFKYYFLKLGNIPFNEQELENDFQTLIRFLEQAPSDFFLYRDFQARNIMIHNDRLFFIDFQGGRKGALAYDLASLLYDGKANLSPEFREILLEHYLKKIHPYFSLDPTLFRKQFYGFVGIRILQAMGTYGLRGFYEKKELFLKSVPYAIQNLSSIQDHLCKALDLHSIEKIIDYLKESKFSRLDLPCGTNLNLAIHSFSFKQGIPDDSSGNGGGFVFDCRFLPNPGRIEAYKNLNGQDTEVVRYFKEYDSVSKFIDECVEITTPSVLNYIERGFSNLQVNFGCTGGRHRSVYCAEQYAQRMAANFQIKIELKHSNRCNW